MNNADWTIGIRDKDKCTEEGLRRSAKIALERAKEWVDTAERLLLKASDLKGQP